MITIARLDLNKERGPFIGWTLSGRHQARHVAEDEEVLHEKLVAISTLAPTQSGYVYSVDTWNMYGPVADNGLSGS